MMSGRQNPAGLKVSMSLCGLLNMATDQRQLQPEQGNAARVPNFSTLQDVLQRRLGGIFSTNRDACRRHALAKATALSYSRVLVGVWVSSYTQMTHVNCDAPVYLYSLQRKIVRGKRQMHISNAWQVETKDIVPLLRVTSGGIHAC